MAQFHCRSPTRRVADFQRRQRPRHALSNNSLISNPLPPSRTQSLQPDFPQPSEMREISAVEREPDSSWRCSENCRRWRNNNARGTSARQAGAAATAARATAAAFLEPSPPQRVFTSGRCVNVLTAANGGNPLRPPYAKYVLLPPLRPADGLTSLA